MNTTNHIKSVTITSYATSLVLDTFLFFCFVVHLILLELKVFLAIWLYVSHILHRNKAQTVLKFLENIL